MRKRRYTALIMLLGAFASGSAVYAAESCPKDSVIGRSENGTCTSKTLYQYDDDGRTISSEIWKMDSDSILVGVIRNDTSYHENGSVDTTTTWKWSTDIIPQGWIGNERNIYTYDAIGNILTWVIESWSKETNTWINKTKFEYEYKNSYKTHLPTLTITSVGDGHKWIFKSKMEKDYDSGGNVIFERYYPTYNGSMWIGDYWNISAYSGENLTLSEKYTWLNGEWSGLSKIENGYSAGELTYTIGYFWDTESKTFVCSSKSKTTYDQWKNIIYSEEYSLVDDKWVGKNKFCAEYTSYQSDPIMVATFTWNTTQAVFIGVDSIRIAKDDADNQILDEQYTWSGNDWAGSKKEEYIYDNNKLILSTIAYAWDVVNKTWINGTKVLADYNANKMQILDERYQWITENGGYWQGTKKDSTVYDAKNVETASFSFQWDDENRRWLGNTKYRKEFDAANNLILEEQYNWQMVDTMAAGGFWKGIKKEEYAYNAAKQQTLAIIYAWSDAITNWIGQTKKISDFDSNKNQILNEQYTWHRDDTMEEGGYWQGTEKATYTFNKNKQQTSSWVYAWNDADIAWVYSTRDTASYDAKKNQTLDERYTYDVTNHRWVGTLKKEYAYNASGQQIMFAYYSWDAENTKWIGTQKEEDEQDAEGRTIMHATYTWNDTDWKGKSKDTYTYFRNDTVYEHITYEWKTTTWVAKNSTIDSYSEKGEHKSTATFKYDATNNTWIGQKLTAWAYTESGKIYIQEEYVWGTTDWVKSTRLVNTYTDEKLTSYTTYKWENEDWVKVKHWEQVDANIDRTYEWLTDKWSITQENKKTYDDQNRLILEQKQNWQVGVQTAGEKTEYTYTGSNLTQKSNYKYDSGISDWNETDRLTNAYDEANHQTLTMTQTFSGGVQTAGDKTTNTYNADGKQTNTTTYKWANGDWQYVSKTDSEYSGNTTIVSNWQWDVTNQAWVGTTKEEKEYGEGKNVTITASEWNTTSQSWQGVSKTGYTYYPNGKEKSVIDYRWTGSDWVADTKTEYEYSGSKNIVTATYSWENDDWVGQSKIGYYYDEGEDLTTATWDWKDATESTPDTWVGNTKMGETFDQFKNRIGQTTYTWNGTDFVYKQKTQIEYGISSKDKTTATYNWDATTNSWKGQSKSGETYNGSKISSQIEYKWISGFDWEYTKKTEYEYEGTNANDKTTATYTWDSENKAWIGVSKSGVTYASNGKIASEFSYVWGETDWIGVKKTEYEYGDGKNNSVAQYVWGDSTWVGKSKIAENYTEQGDSLSFYTYCWKNGDWSDSLKREYTYNEYGDITQYIDASWNSSTSVWSNKETSTQWNIVYYDYENGKILLDEKKVWSIDLNWFVGSGQKKEYSYDMSGRLICTITSKPSGYVWLNYTKVENKYDDDGNVIYFAKWDWDKKKGDWKGSTKYEYAYDNGIQIMKADYNWDKNLWTWHGNTKSETKYENGLKVTSITYNWKDTCWIFYQRIDYQYDGSGRETQIIYSVKDDNDGWVYDEKREYAYDRKGNKSTNALYYWINDQWQLIHLEQKLYDSYGEYNLRSEESGTWTSDGRVTTYQQKFYYYACDPVITLIASPEEGGKVSGGGANAVGAEINISATPNDCYTFDHWEDEDGNTDTNNPKKVTVTEDKTYTAIFSPVKHTIRASVKLDSDGTAAGGFVRVTLKPKK